MIPDQLLSSEVELSRSRGRTTSFLRNLTIFVVKSALRVHYGDDYCIRCLQASHAFKTVLGRMGLRGTLWTGDVCFAEAFANPPFECRFGGFWDQDHHVWLVTEFTEIVDLTISQMHLHPARSRSDGLPIPPVWWDDVSRWPLTIRYLPRAPIRVELPDAEAADLATFEGVLQRVSREILEQLDPSDVPAFVLLHGPDAMNELHAAGHPWVLGTFAYQLQNVPLPDYISRRENELMHEWQARQER